MSSQASAKLPPMFAVATGDECRHRFICRSRLLLRVAGLLRLATTAFEHALDGSELLNVRQRPRRRTVGSTEWVTVRPHDGYKVCV